MKRALMIFAGLLLVAAPATTLAQGNDDKTMQLLERVANATGGKADVFVGALPNDVPKVPLPEATVVGSIHQTGQIGNMTSVDSYQVYYDATAGTLSAYETALGKAGWTQASLPTAGVGGFTPDISNIAFYCKAGLPMITAQTADSTPGDLRVSISTSSTNDMLCNGGNNTLNAAMAMMKTPLPTLKAPAGAKLTISLIPPLGQSSATVQSASSISDLLSAFGKQMTTAGWTAGVTSAAPTLATQTFSITKDKTAWQSVLTIMAIPGKTGEYAAFISAMKLQ